MRFPLRDRLVVVGVGLVLGSPIASQAAHDGLTTTVGVEPRNVESSSQSVRARFSAASGHCLRLAVAGVGTRNSAPAPPANGGTIELPPGPDGDNVHWAGLYWLVLDSADPGHDNQVTLNGAPVQPVSLPVNGSPCWAEARSYAYFAEVTDLVRAGGNVVGSLPDSGSRNVAPETEGASLIVVYESPTRRACEIIITDGNDLLRFGGRVMENPLPVECGTSVPANLWFVGGDGQAGQDGQFWNGSDLGSGDDFDGSDPLEAGAQSGWDSDGHFVLTQPPNSAEVRLPVLGTGDCVNWIATAIEVGVQDCNPVGVEVESWGRVKDSYR